MTELARFALGVGWYVITGGLAVTVGLLAIPYHLGRIYLTGRP